MGEYVGGGEGAGEGDGGCVSVCDDLTSLFLLFLYLFTGGVRGGAGADVQKNRSPMNPERYAVKRIIALEGDIVLTKSPYPHSREEVPFGHVWVEGDQVDGNKTMDSNRVGPVSKSLIVGRVGGVVWPWRKAGRIRWEDWRGSDRVLVGQGTVVEYEFFH